MSKNKSWLTSPVQPNFYLPLLLFLWLGNCQRRVQMIQRERKLEKISLASALAGWTQTFDSSRKMTGWHSVSFHFPDSMFLWRGLGVVHLTKPWLHNQLAFIDCPGWMKAAEMLHHDWMKLTTCLSKTDPSISPWPLGHIMVCLNVWLKLLIVWMFIIFHFMLVLQKSSSKHCT